LKETLSANSYTESTLSTSSLSGPSGIVVDGSGNVYIADTGNNRVLKVGLSAGSYTENTVPTSALHYPMGIAVDGSGNVYVDDIGDNRVLKEDFADPPSLRFVATATGSTSSDSPRTVTLKNVGNTALNFPAPGSGNNPSVTANFTVNSSGAFSCPSVSAGSSTAGTLAVGQSCLLPISFTALSAGTFNDTLILTDDALNATAPNYAIQSIVLSGTGTEASQTINFTVPTSPVIYGVSPIVLSATTTSGWRLPSA
jgi:hypothetical protein